MDDENDSSYDTYAFEDIYDDLHDYHSAPTIHRVYQAIVERARQLLENTELPD